MKLPSSSESNASAEVAQAQPAPSDAQSPRRVIRGESLDLATHHRPGLDSVRVLTDWLNFSFPVDGYRSVGAVLDLVDDATDGAFGAATDRGRGLHGYTESHAFEHGGAILACGGQRRTGFLSLPGDACALVPDWDRFVALGQRVLLGRITRWDGAVDDFGGLHSVDLAVELFKQGWFNAGGRTPTCMVAGDWIAGACQGRTLYVGRRQNGKLLRVYEKGKQFGDPRSLWVRWEVEFHNVDRVIPWGVLLEPADYVAGAYPCMAWVGEFRTRIKTIRAQDGISYNRLKDAASLSYGALINVMLEREGSAERVVEILRRSGAPKRLKVTDRYLRRSAEDKAE